MLDSIHNQDLANMVNYTNVLTSIPNEVYVPTTQTPDSLASLIKNNILIEFSLTPKLEECDLKQSEKSTSLSPVAFLW
jgi:hypothetical protein